ncbi:MAG: hypothetical protein HUU10_03845 [Bacteroidetes bacterium]|nr:hypothetical protein [Bacteroidota bacterium]
MLNPRHAFPLLLVASLITPLLLSAQGTAGSAAEIEPRFVIDFPSAGALRKGTYTVDSRLEPGGGLVTGMNVGMSDRFSFGVSYGGSNVIGNGNPGWNPQASINIRYRFYEETDQYPAVVVGYDMQGYGGWVDSTSRYLSKSPGLFAVASKNYELLGFIILTGGINYSIERKDGDSDLNFWGGVEKTLNSEISALLEYSTGFNDNSRRSVGKGRGSLNAGLRWSVGAGLTLELSVKNLNNNLKSIDPGGRAVRLEYTNFF